MKYLIVLSLLLAGNQSFTQYYYNDLLSNQYSNNQFQIIKANKIKQVQVKSFDASGQAAEGFSLVQEFSAGYSQSTTTSNTAANISEASITNYNADQVTATNEIAKGVETKVAYTYLQNGKLETISSSTTDTALHYQTTEKHIWQYSNNGKPVQMLRIKNTTDTTFIVFSTDEQGNIAEEHWKKKGKDIETYFYYYNTQNQLTDIVRFNKRVQKLLPDFLFEYDAQNRIAAMTQVPAGNSNYIIWNYSYNDKGLKQSEVCTNRQKELIAKVQYTYQ
jgi:hypothetical protein